MVVLFYWRSTIGGRFYRAILGIMVPDLAGKKLDNAARGVLEGRCHDVSLARISL